MALVRLLDAELKAYNGDADAFHSQFNSASSVTHVVVVWEDDVASSTEDGRCGSRAVACGGLRVGSSSSSSSGDSVGSASSSSGAEVKRMYVVTDRRGKGVAGVVLTELERWATELGLSRLFLETGRTLPGAVRLYTKAGYVEIPNYPPYVDDPISACFEKQLLR